MFRGEIEQRANDVKIGGHPEEPGRINNHLRVGRLQGGNKLPPASGSLHAEMFNEVRLVVALVREPAGEIHGDQ